VPKPRISMFCWSLSASLMASRKASTTRAQSFFEIIGPAVRAMDAVTCSTRSALVMRPPVGFNPPGGPPEPGSEGRVYGLKRCLSRAWGTCTAPGPQQPDEFVEMGVGIVRPRGRLGMVLHRENGQVLVAQAFNRLVVEVHVG